MFCPGVTSYHPQYVRRSLAYVKVQLCTNTRVPIVNVQAFRCSAWQHGGPTTSGSSQCDILRQTSRSSTALWVHCYLLTYLLTYLHEPVIKMTDKRHHRRIMKNNITHIQKTNVLITKVHDTHSNKLRQLMAQLSCAIELLQQLHNCVSNKLPKQTCSYTDMDASQLLLLATSFYSPSVP